ncbi:MAG: hypothetical protein M1833_002994 [Piccolia ochrophora]|nr:MAG: hypothetical protein M1833_002994 [Piccolia ochrophora]
MAVDAAFDARRDSPSANAHADEKDIQLRDSLEDDRPSLSSSEMQGGVKRVEAVSLTWTKWSLILAYVGIFLMAFSTSLESQTTLALSIYATSSFQTHSLVSVVLVVQSIVNAVIKPPMAKIADVFGRLEAFSISVFLYVLGYIQMAASKNVQTYASAQIFYSAGGTGLQILQQIFIADTSDLLNRALWSTLPDVPFLITVWVGPEVASSILTRTTWRWGYALWVFVLLAAFLPLATSLFVNSRKAARLGLLPPPPWEGQKVGSFLKTLWYDLDVGGLLLLSAALALILLPLSLAATAGSGWRNDSIIAMLVIGFACAVAFPFWETNARLAPRPFMPMRIMKNRTVLAGCAIAFFYFMAFYLSVQPYFNSYLQVVKGSSVGGSGRVTNTFSFSSTVTSLAVSLAIKYSAHYKYFILLGACIYLMALGLMVRYRSEDSSIGSIVGTQIALGIGGGMLNVPAQLGVQASVRHQDVAVVTAIFLTILEIGGAVGSAISGAVWTAGIQRRLQLYLPDSAKPQAALIFGSITVAQSYAMGSPERIAINRAYQETIHTLLIIAACVSIPLIPLTLLMKNYKLNRIDQNVKGKVIGALDREPVGENYDDLSPTQRSFSREHSA